ncbi:MAG TPA: ExbD/TolR family protein [Stellaceae bacterium]|jgi:biopolymer transport protein ExbD
MALSHPPTGEPNDDRYAPLAEINVTPMVDVMLVLLVIFMITAPLLVVGVPLNLPKTRAAAIVAPKEPIIVSLDRQGQTFIGNNPVPSADLEARLQALAAQDPARLVYVRGDRTITYAQLMDVLSEVNRAGFAKVTLVAAAAGTK